MASRRHEHNEQRATRALLASVASVVAVLVAIGIYFQLGWSRMSAECGSHMPDVPNGGMLSVGYSWHPVSGFTCSYSDDTERTSYWFR
jgi:hypothetical protein